MAIEHSTIVDGEIHEPKGISSATSGQLYVADGLGSGSWDTVTSEQVLVFSESDFPAPVDVGGVMTIVPEAKEYIIQNTMNLSYPIAFPGTGLTTTIRSLNRSVVTYTGTQALFRDPDAQGAVEIFGLTEWTAPSANMFDITAGTGGFTFQAQSAPRFTNCNSLGTIDCNGTSRFNTFYGTFSDFDQGLVVIDPLFFEINTMFCFGNNQTGCTYFTVQGASTTGSVNMFNCTFTVGSNETVWDFDSTINAGVDSINLIGNTLEGTLDGAIFAAGSLDLDTVKLYSSSNNGLLANTTPDALASMRGNTTATVIAAANTPVKVAGSFTDESSQHFTIASDGRITYNGIRDITIPIDAAITAISENGTDDIALYFAKNGTVIANSGGDAEIQAVDPTRLSILWQLSFSTNDYFELFVENQTDTSNITIQNAVIRAN